jgi:uncharacterized protein
MEIVGQAILKGVERMNKSKQSFDTIQSEAELRLLIGYPSELVRKKVIHSIDRHVAEFISKSPFLVLATADENGSCDASPKGDTPGFVQILNEKQLVIPERPGNKRIDSLRNILANPSVGLIFFIPGLGETLRVNGKAVLVIDQELLDKMAIKGKNPLLGILVEVEECYIHCAKAFKRSGLWEPESWADKATLPSAAKALFDHARLPGQSVDSIQEKLDESYIKRLY